MTDTKKYPLPSNEQEDVEEALGLLWHRFEANAFIAEELKQEVIDSVGDRAWNQLVHKNWVTETAGKLTFTSEGERHARDVVRRHRLAERLLMDVLSLDHHAIDTNACQLEHIISPEVTDSICTLLGHPLFCPHGLNIPRGLCCGRAEKSVEPLVAPLSRMKSGQGGRVAYVHLQDHPEMHKLLSLGVVPGTMIHLHQTSPAFVVDLGESQLALEEAVAQNIYVRRLESPKI